MTGAKLDQSKLKKTGFYKKQILVIQENIKLFTVIIGLVTLVMLILNIVNACTGGIGFGWVIFLNTLWIALVGGFVVYMLIGAKRKRDSFEKLDEMTYGDFKGDYMLCVIDNAEEPLVKGSVVRLYENEKFYYLVSDGVRKNRNGYWTKYNFKQDFGTLWLDKAAFQRSEQEGIIVLDGENENISLRRK